MEMTMDGTRKLHSAFFNEKRNACLPVCSLSLHAVLILPYHLKFYETIHFYSHNPIAGAC